MPSAAVTAPQMFGAVGDGVSDDAGALQRALDPMVRTGGTLDLGSATCRLASFHGPEDEYFRAMVGVDLQAGASLSSRGKAATIVSSTNIGLSAVGFVFLMVRGGSQLDVSGVTLLYSGGPTAKVVSAGSFDVSFVRVGGWTFRNSWTAVQLRSSNSKGMDGAINPRGIESAVITRNFFLANRGSSSVFTLPRPSGWPSQAITAAHVRREVA